jgi:hypothetical protein
MIRYSAIFFYFLFMGNLRIDEEGSSGVVYLRVCMFVYFYTMVVRCVICVYTNVSLSTTNDDCFFFFFFLSFLLV